MSEFQRDIARIERTTLGYEDHGIFTVWLHLKYGPGTGQGAGGYALDEPIEIDGKTRRQGTAYGMEFIVRVMRACGVDEWRKVTGRTIYAVREPGWSGKVIGIEPLPTEPGEPFIFDELREQFYAEAA